MFTSNKRLLLAVFIKEEDVGGGREGSPLTDATDAMPV